MRMWIWHFSKNSVKLKLIAQSRWKCCSIISTEQPKKGFVSKAQLAILILCGNTNYLCVSEIEGCM